MSIWTNIKASILIKDFKNYEEEDIQGFIQEINAYAPKITGSEGNATIYVEVENDYSEKISWLDINIEGNLRDRDSEQVRKEFDYFLSWLKNYPFVINQAVCFIY